jgi:hypothetical protein
LCYYTVNLTLALVKSLSLLFPTLSGASGRGKKSRWR